MICFLDMKGDGTVDTSFGQGLIRQSVHAEVG